MRNLEDYEREAKKQKEALRDRIAMEIMKITLSKIDPEDFREVAAKCYFLADCMMEARKQTLSGSDLS